jgi:farnesyl-diphosphate farnesyltransferase
MSKHLGVLLSDPVALVYLLRVKKWDSDAKKLPKDKALAFCYGPCSSRDERTGLLTPAVAKDVLNRVSRSFAIVIQQLGPELRDAVCVFYLVLRGLDTVEDDMSIPQAPLLLLRSSRGS